jgi:translation initiation factor eIF-2B subunit gamma
VQRVTNVQSYLSLNKDVPSHAHSSATPWPPVAGYQRKEQSVIGEECELGDKVTVKQSSVGRGCHVGARSKLNNCVIMDGVTIGENVTIQNTVVSALCVVEGNSNLNDCCMGSGAKVAAGSKIKGEAISVNSN